MRKKRKEMKKEKKKNFIDPNTLAYFARALLVLVESLRKPKLIFFSIRWFVPSLVQFRRALQRKETKQKDS
jgi:hypothetical protein